MGPTNAELDARILFFAHARYMKVARILGNVLHDYADKGIEVSEDTLQTRLDYLLDTGKLEAAGNVSNWRHSEVRLTD